MPIQDDLNSVMANDPMDGSLDLQAGPSDISPDILLPISPVNSNSSLALQSSSSTIANQVQPAFSNKVPSPTGMAGSVHVEIPAFMSPMDVLDPSSRDLLLDYPPPHDPFSQPENLLHTPSAGSTHSASASPPLVQVPSPPACNLVSSYNVPGSSSISSALDSSVVTSAALSSIMVPILSNGGSFPFMSDGALSQLSSLPSSSTAPSDALAGAKKEPLPIFSSLEDMLERIVITANTAKIACQNYRAAEASTEVDSLKDDITVVSGLVEQLMSHLTTLPAVGEPTVGTDVPRKRCASAVESERTAKSLKREPPEDMVLLNDVDMPPDTQADHMQSAVVQAIPPPMVLTSNGVSPSAPATPPPPPVQFAVSSFTTPHPMLGTTTVVPAPTMQPGLVPPTALAVPAVTPATIGSALTAPLVAPSGCEGATLSGVTTPVAYPPFGAGVSVAPSPLEYPSGIVPPLDTSGSQFTSAAPGRQAWSQTISLPRHRHSLSAGSLIEVQPIPSMPFMSAVDGVPFPSLSGPPAGPATVNTIGPPAGRMSRSGSISGQFTSPFGFSIGEHVEPTPPAWPDIARLAGPTSAPTVLTGWHTPVAEGAEPPPPKSETNTSSPDDDDESDYESGDDADDVDIDESESPNRSSQHLPFDSLPSQHSSSSDVPQEYLSEVNRIFFDYLNRICSDETATDSKNDKIHQALMPKKMQRLAESPDFRPFKFRIQAFTHAFLEELAAHGYPEEKIPMKKIRNYLWKQPLILRFNADGKKAKSKGNHIWQVDAKKIDDGKWDFRPFTRKLAGKLSTVAYCGLRWEHTPNVWDPQASWAHIPVQYSSPSLPPWLSWKDGVLSGVPPPDAQSCDITVIAKYVLDGQEGQLTRKFTVNIAPVSTIETSFSQSRRLSTGAEPQVPRRRSDSSVQQTVHRPTTQPAPAVEPAPAQAQVVRVLQTAAHRVAVERQSHRNVPTHGDGEIQDLVKQQHVLDRVASAVVIDARTPQSGSTGARQLAAAAQKLVFQAAQTVLADKTSVSGTHPAVEQNNVTISEVSDKTQGAVAQAVRLHGTTSKEFDVVVTATNILKDGHPPPVSPSDDGQICTPELPRPHTTGSLPSRSYPSLPAYSASTFSAPISTNNTP